MKTITTNHTLVRCESLTKNYHDVRALTDFSISISRGEIITLLGPSGCGKTTALRLIAGFEIPTQGTIEINHNLIASQHFIVPPERRNVGMVFQNYALFPHLSVFDNIEFGLSNGKRDKNRVYELLELVGLPHLERRMPHELSGGQQQRVSLARALAPNPDLLLLDEPFSNLDTNQRESVREDVRAILKSNKATAIFVTHDQEEAFTLGDQIVVLNQGCVEQIGTPKEVYQSPNSYFVAQFLGESNFLRGTTTATGFHSELGCHLQTVYLPPGTPVNILIRPHELELTKKRDNPCTITRKNFRGREYLYWVQLPSKQTIQCTMPAYIDFSVGESISLQLKSHIQFSLFPIRC